LEGRGEVGIFNILHGKQNGGHHPDLKIMNRWWLDSPDHSLDTSKMNSYIDYGFALNFISIAIFLLIYLL